MELSRLGLRVSRKQRHSGLTAPAREDFTLERRRIKSGEFQKKTDTVC